MPIYLKNDYTQLQIKKKNFIDKLKTKLNKTSIVHTHTHTQIETNIYIYKSQDMDSPIHR